MDLHYGFPEPFAHTSTGEIPLATDTDSKEMHPTWGKMISDSDGEDDFGADPTIRSTDIDNDFAAVSNEDILAISLYPHIAAAACYLQRSKLDPFRFGVSTSELTLKELLNQHYPKRKDLVEKGPYIDIYLGTTRVYKRVSKTLLYAFCPDIGRFIDACNGRFLVRLPHGLSNVLAVKLAVQYMEESVMHPKFRMAEWKVRGESISHYIALAELFAFIGCEAEAEKLERGIVRRLREFPLSMEQVQNVWGRENALYPGRYGERLAENIVTWMCVPKLEAWMAQWAFDEDIPYAEIVAKKIREMAERYAASTKLALFNARHATDFLDRFLEEPKNVALKQLVWAADSFAKPTKPDDPDEFILIATVAVLLPRHLAGMRKVELRKKSKMLTPDEEV